MASCASILLIYSLFQHSRHYFVKSQPFSLVTSSESDVELQGFVYKSFTDSKLSICFFNCMDEGICQSINFDTEKFQCQLNKGIKRHRPENVRAKEHSVYMENPERVKKGSHPRFPGHSCKEIKDLGESRGDGEYWIDPGNTGKPFTVYCDMTTDSGGWTLIQRAELPTTNPTSFVRKHSYRLLSSYADYKQVIVDTVLQKLREDMGFHQLRFRCRKKSIDRTIHIKTTNNTAGHKVLDHFLVKATWPTACNSFERLADDTSILAQNCLKWGVNTKVNRWGTSAHQGSVRIYSKTIMLDRKHCFSSKSPEFYCDDFKEATYGAVNVGDIWEIFVR